MLNKCQLSQEKELHFNNFDLKVAKSSSFIHLFPAELNCFPNFITFTDKLSYTINNIFGRILSNLKDSLNINN